MRVAAALLFLCLALPAFGQSREHNGERRTSATQAFTNQIIVKWRDGAASTVGEKNSSRLQKLGSSAGMQLQRKHQIGTGTDVLQMERVLDANELSALLARIAADPDVEYAVADQYRWPHALPADPLFNEQWYFQNVQPSATRAEQAWDVTVGSSTTIVAVLDTGVRFEHPDLLRVAQAGKLLDGFDFVSNSPFANDGDSRDNNPADPGDWVSATDMQQAPFNIPACELADSSWHGTRTSSLIAALTNNAQGLAGSGWNTLVLPVRVLGKCGGTDSDIIAGMRWAAGINVPGVPTNTRPAQIINLSLGGSGACSAAYQSAVNEITARGVLLVASVGNEGGAVASPANCTGVLGVTGLRHAGTKVGFSNLGPGSTIGAPGGNCVNSQGMACLFFIEAATNTGTTVPATDTYTTAVDAVPNVGTSFSAPIVAGAAALMHSLNARLAPAEYITLLSETASPFPTTSATTTTVCHVPAGDLQPVECICTTQTCGAGMLNTQAAVLAAQRPFAIAQAPNTITTGTDIAISGSNSFASNGRTVTGYQWTAIGVTGAAPAFVAPTQAATTFQVSGASAFTLRLTVTDDQGAQDTTDVAMATAVAPPPPPPPPPPPSGGGGGGGGGDIGGLMLAVLLLLARRKSLRLMSFTCPVSST
jgi:serine protease